MSDILSKIKSYLLGALLLAVSGLLLLLRLKSDKLQALQIKTMEDRFKAEDDKEDAKVKAAKDKYDGSGK